MQFRLRGFRLGSRAGLDIPETTEDAQVGRGRRLSAALALAHLPPTCLGGQQPPLVPGLQEAQVELLLGAR